MSVAGAVQSRKWIGKVLAAALIAVIATALALAGHALPGARVAMSGIDETLYDSFYHFRNEEDRTHDGIVIVDVDESSLETLNSANRIDWPWPRDLWGATVKYMEACGARAIVFDVKFKDKRAFDNEFAQALDAANIPVILANDGLPSGPDRFGPPVKKKMRFGATNILEDKVVRTYKTEVQGLPSLAVETARAIGAPLPAWANQTFRLHFFGPNVRRDGKSTFNYLPAFRVVKAAMVPKKAASVSITPDMFEHKIVLVGGSATGTFDLKSCPLSPIYPGVEIHATAIDDLLSDQVVDVASRAETAAISALAAFIAAAGVLIPRKTVWKVILAAVAAYLLAHGALIAFEQQHIHWLPLASPLTALGIAVVGAFAWSYLTEDRQRRFVLKALSQYVSPDVASEIEKNPSTLKLGGQRREMTVMFSDIQGFTDLSEAMDSQKLSEMLNFYLGEMSGLILENDGTLDKYIGDAIMCFWNAPVIQQDHAALACRAALAMRRREAEIQPQLETLGAKGLLTRIGINSGPMIFGNMGAPQKFNYSVLGDSVNLGSRLEGANKFYGSRILISQTTAELVRDRFVLRKLDALRVKGRLAPLDVYELMAEGAADANLAARVTQYELALSLYREQKWDEAAAALIALHERYPEDAPALALHRRIEKLRLDPPAADWDGVFVAKDK